MKKISILILLAVVAFSCKKWDDYTTDYDYISVYFAHQNQVRTIVAEDNWGFDFGVTLAGKREYDTREWARYKIDPELLQTVDGAERFTLLPSSMYTLSDPDMFRNTPPSMLCTARITLNDTFLKDPEAIKNTYALPVRVVETSVDSILRGKYDEDGTALTAPKDYAVIVIKYINPYHGNYYSIGRQMKKVEGEWIDDGVYSEKDLSKNRVVALTTETLEESTTVYAGTALKNAGLKLIVNGGNVAVEKSPDAPANFSVTSGSGTYDAAKREFTLRYEYMAGADEFKVEERLVHRNTERKFETWEP